MYKVHEEPVSDWKFPLYKLYKYSEKELQNYPASRMRADLVATFKDPKLAIKIQKILNSEESLVLKDINHDDTNTISE